MCHQLIEQHNDFSQAAIIGVQPRGTFLAQRIYTRISEILQNKNLLFGKLDITFYRDDFRQKGNVLALSLIHIYMCIRDRCQVRWLIARAKREFLLHYSKQLFCAAKTSIAHLLF